MQTMRSKLCIVYNGVEATDIIADDCDSFTWKDNATGSADTVTLNLNNTGQKWMNGYFPSAEDSFKAWIQISEWAADYREGNIFCGTFMVDSLRYSGFPETLQLSGISMPVDCNFNVKQKNKSWEKTTVKTVLSDIAKNAGISLDFYADDINIESANQTGKTDLAFAYSICSEYGLALKLYNQKMVVYDQTKFEKEPSRYAITHDQLGGSGSYNITREVTTVYDSAKIQYTNGKKGNALTYEFIMPGTTGSRQMFITTKAESLADAEKKAKAALRENRRKSQSITIKMMGSAKYMAADCFDLVGFGKLDGKYFIDSVIHSKSGGKYTVSLSAHLVEVSF